ncbi:hypothetical protein Q9R32_01785 [Actinotalea sp. AC32]|nr:hypothetical protein [Actinotalea sp. AC32]
MHAVPLTEQLAAPRVARVTPAGRPLIEWGTDPAGDVLSVVER